MQAIHHMKDATNMTAKLKASHHKWNFNKLEAAHAINHMKDATNIALHIQRCLVILIDAGYKKQ